MQQDAWRDYLELALGVTEASRRKATEVIRSLADQSGSRFSDLQGMAEELVTTGMANRENLTKLVRFELDRALGKVGLATSDEVAELSSRVQQLETELRHARKQAETAERAAAAAQSTVGVKAAARPAAKTVKKSSAKKSTAKKATAKKSAAKKTAAKSTVAKSTAKKTAKKVVKKVVKKSTPRKSGA